jgi:hypothetical protein
MNVEASDLFLFPHSNFWLAPSGRPAYVFGMSAAEILAELPKLDDRERRAIQQRLWELETQRQELEFAAAAADLAFQHLDQMEAEDAGSTAR